MALRWMVALALGAPIAASLAQSRPTGAAIDCVSFHSARLTAGTPFTAPLRWGLDFRLSADWRISVGPHDDPTADWAWVVSPPVQPAPQMQIGPGYGLTARQSADLSRRLRFVIAQDDYSAAKTAVESGDAGAALKRVEELGRGRLNFTIIASQVHPVTDGPANDAFDWIAFEGEACLDPTSAADVARGRAKWTAQRPATYEFGVEVRCFCVGISRTPPRFRVTGTESTPLVELTADARRTYSYYDTIDKIFDVVDRAMARGADKADIQLDDRYGFPAVADLDPSFRIFDDETFLRVVDFKAIHEARPVHPRRTRR